MSDHTPAPPICLLICLGLGFLLPATEGNHSVTDEFGLGKRRFSASGGNPYMSLNPGARSVLEGEENGSRVEILTTVMDRRRWVSFDDPRAGRVWVRTRVVEERITKDGELTEISRRFFARCRRTSDIFYFGRRVWTFRDGIFSGSDGTWEAGVNGARPGLFIPGTYLLGSRYDRETAPGHVLRRAEHTAMGMKVQVKAGEFSDCVEVAVTDAFQPEAEPRLQVYCPGAGLALDGLFQLADYRHGIDPDSSGN